MSANRAAQRNLHATPGPIGSVATLSPAAAVRLSTLPAGAREILRLDDGRTMLVRSASFAAEGRRLTLVSLQSVASDLDAVELKAWQDLARVLAHEIAHEMMNSLTPILSLSDSLGARLKAKGAAPAALADDAEVIARRSERLMRFVERYRSLIDLPQPELAKVPAAELAASLDGLMRPMMTQAGVDYASRVLPQALSLWLDRDLIEQALINLLKNALEAVGGREGASVRLAILQEEGQVALVVEDNGPGLPQDDPEAVFVPFFTTKAGGSGVGLTLARQIALAHGGWLDAATGDQGGAVFKISVPT